MIVLIFRLLTCLIINLCYSCTLNPNFL